MFGVFSIAQAQTVNSLSANALARSGRLKISGSGFGAAQGTVRIGGVSAPVSSWSDASITAYVSESAPLGQQNAQVVTANGASSNFLPLTVTVRPFASGRVRWRFQVDAPYINGRPGIGADGTIYSADLNGHLYALTPDGGLKWIFNAAPGGPVKQSVDVGADGTIYFARGNALYAVNPDGTQKWRVADQISFREIESGPNVGPDGNIYAATDDFPQDGLGFFVVSPAGQILRNTPGFFEGDDAAFFAREIFFGSNRVYHQLGNQNNPDGNLSFHQLGGEFLFERSAVNDRNPAIAPDGTIYAVIPPTTAFSNSNLRAYDPNGNSLRTFFGENTNYLTTPDVGADGTIYVGRNFNLITALNPNGSQKWQFTGSGILDNPTVNRQNSVVVIGGYQINAPGFVQGIGASNGQLLWTLTLPEENGGFIRPSARPKFSANGATVYVGTSLSSTSPDVYSYLYAIQVVDAPPLTSAVISGRVTNPQGQSIGATVLLTLTGGNLTQPLQARATPAGYFRFEVPAGQAYTVTPVPDERTFTPTSRQVTLSTENVFGVDFTTP